MVDRSSFHQVSQTQLEQGELIQYECNLAACYEAEYLLSLKIQEEMCHHRNLYNDPSEVMVASAVDTAVTIDAQPLPHSRKYHGLLSCSR